MGAWLGVRNSYRANLYGTRTVWTANRLGFLRSRLKPRVLRINIDIVICFYNLKLTKLDVRIF